MRRRAIGVRDDAISRCTILACRTPTRSSRRRRPSSDTGQARCFPDAEGRGASEMAIRIEREGAVVTVIIDRTERRNAVDAQTARELADAFRAVEADPAIRAAVLWGAGGTFCAGADLKALGSEGGRMKPTGDGPMGPRACCCPSR